MNHQVLLLWPVSDQLDFKYIGMDTTIKIFHILALGCDTIFGTMWISLFLLWALWWCMLNIVGFNSISTFMSGAAYSFLFF